MMYSVKPGARVIGYQTSGPLPRTAFESIRAAEDRACSQGPCHISGLHVENKGRFEDGDKAGNGTKYELTALRSAEHQQERPGELDRISIWLSDSGLGHFDLDGSDHVSLELQKDLMKAFTTRRFETLLQGLDVPPGIVWAYYCNKTCRLWLAPLVMVSTITWLAPGANALATMLWYRHVMPAAAAEARSVYNQVLSRQLLAELAHLQELRDAAPMMTADEQLSHIRGLTVKQLISNPMSRLEVKLHPEQLQAVTTLVDDMMASIDGPAPHIVKGLDQKRATHKDANMCDEMLYTLAMKMTQVEVVLRNLAMEVKAYQAGEATRQLVLGQVEELKEANLKGLP